MFRQEGKPGCEMRCDWRRHPPYQGTWFPLRSNQLSGVRCAAGCRVRARTPQSSAGPGPDLVFDDAPIGVKGEIELEAIPPSISQYVHWEDRQLGNPSRSNLSRGAWGARLPFMLLETGKSRLVSESQSSLLRFGEEEKSDGQWAGRRLLWQGSDPAFELSWWCGTCPLLFKRLEGATETVSLPGMQQTLNSGIENIDDGVLDAFAAILPGGSYVPMLLKVQPELVYPGRKGDYFSEEQVDTWGVSGFWGLPEYPQTPYYRTWQAPVDPTAHAFEFVVPMVPPTWNEPDRVEEYAQKLLNSSTPTAVAVSILDVCQPAMDNGTDYYAHWGITHFLLDGHHKMQAAAEAKRPLQLLSLLSIEGSLAQGTDIERVVELRAEPQSHRNAAARG